MSNVNFLRINFPCIVSLCAFKSAPRLGFDCSSKAVLNINLISKSCERFNYKEIKLWMSIGIIQIYQMLEGQGEAVLLPGCKPTKTAVSS